MDRFVSGSRPRRNYSDAITTAIILVALLAIAAIVSTYGNPDWVSIGDPSEFTSLDCVRHEFVLPDRRGLVATMRRVECAHTFPASPTTRDCFVFVHRAGETDDRHNLIFRYKWDDEDPHPDVAPELSWIGDSTLRVAMGVRPDYFVQRTPANPIKIQYRFGASGPANE